MACAKWLVQSARPLTLFKCDKLFRAFIEALFRGAWSPPSFRNIHDKILQHPDLDEASARAMATLKGVWAAD